MPNCDVASSARQFAVGEIAERGTEEERYRALELVLRGRYHAEEAQRDVGQRDGVRNEMFRFH
jgi:hypothetical protein